MIITIILTTAFGFLGYLVWRGVRRYQLAEGSVWSRLKSAANESSTIAWNVGNAASIAAIAGVTFVSEWLGMPGVKEALEPYLKPEYMLTYMLVVTLGSVLTRYRSIRKLINRDEDE